MNKALPRVGLGCWAIGGPYFTDGEPTGWSGPLDETDIVAAIQLAIDGGITHFDTADVYGYGRSERLLGMALAGRDDVTVASKVGWAATTSEHVYCAENIRHQVQTSLRNLRRDRIDVYYVHHCNFGTNDRYLEEAVRTLQDLKSAGDIASIGLSGYAADELMRVASILKPEFIQSWADIEHTEFIAENSRLASFMTTEGISFVAMMPLGQGRLLGKYDPNVDATFGDGDNRQGSDSFTSESLKGLAPRLAALRARFGSRPEDLIQVALQFLLSYPIVSTVIPGFRNKQQVDEIVRSLDRGFSSADRDFVLRAFPRAEMPPHPWA